MAILPPGIGRGRKKICPYRSRKECPLSKSAAGRLEALTKLFGAGLLTPLKRLTEGLPKQFC